MAVELLREIMFQTGGRQFQTERGAIAGHCSRLIAEGRYTAFLATLPEGGRPLGFISLTEAHALYVGGAFGVIPEFYVRPGFRSEGIGRSLMEAARVHARARGWLRLEVTTPPLPQFERTLQFYEGQGFEVTGGRKMKMAL